MSFQDVMNKIRYWDNLSAKWIIRHFYILFFEIVLIAIFIIFFFNITQLLDFMFDVQRDDLVQRLLLTDSINSSIIVLLLLLNSFWMLYLFSTLLRIQGTLKDVSFQLGRRRD